MLQGIAGPKARDEILRRFSAPQFVSPNRSDHVDAADLRDRCRRKGMRLTMMDALTAQLCIRHDLTLLSADADFRHAARVCPLRVWQGT